MTAVATAYRLQFALIVKRPLESVALMTAPLLTIVFGSIARNAGSADFLVSAVLGTGLIGLWVLTVNQVGEIVASDRWLGNLELYIASPASLAALVLGRIGSVVSIGSVAFVESYLVGVLIFRVRIDIHHPLVFGAALVASLIAVAGTACLIAPLFVLTRNTTLYQTTLTYPFYILGTVLFPASILPAWVRPVTHAVFLSWSAQLLRDAAAAAPVTHVAGRLAALIGLGLLAYLIGHLCTGMVIRRITRTGTVDRA